MKIKLNNVRLSFPNIFTPKAFTEGQKPKFSASFLIDPETQSDQIKAVKDAISACATAKWRDKVPKGLKLCLQEGDNKDYDGYEGLMYLSASDLSRPVLVDRSKNPIVEADGILYAGCYVNAVVDLWAQDNQYGKRINASLKAIQFVSDGEPFATGGAKVNVDEEFDTLDELDNDPLFS